MPDNFDKIPDGSSLGSDNGKFIAPKFIDVKKNPIKPIISSVGKANTDTNLWISKLVNTIEDISGGLIPFKINTTGTQILLDNTIPLIYRSRMTARVGDIFDIKSTLGTPIVDRLKFILTPAQLKRAEANPNLPVTIPIPPGLIAEPLPETLNFDEVLITVTQTKNIVRTQIAGNNGTVKEMVGLDDYVITINGRFSGDYNSRNRPLLVLLKDFCESEATIKCSSNYLQDLDILDLVITDYDFPQTEGEYSTQYFTINAISDTKVENQFINFF